MYQIESGNLSISIKSKGAELTSIINKDTELEYLWNADPHFWAKSSPVLFPVVGTLKDHTYYYKNKPYHLLRHGFAREKEFSVTDHQKDTIRFSINSDEESIKNYPFHFSFSLEYKVENDELTVRYIVENKEASDEILFSVGGHPAFKVPLTQDSTYEDYELIFDREETAGRWPVTKEGLIAGEPEPLLNQTNVLPLSKELFLEDALVFKNLQSTSVRLHSNKTPHGLSFDFTGFPYLGIWAAPGADFVCIEPWCGIADSVNTDQQLQNKEGIITLPAGKVFEVEWRVRFY